MSSYTLRRLLKKLKSPKPPISPVQQTPTKKIIFANRVDGFGERLCAMINARRLADYLDADFRFSWTSKIWNDAYNLTTADGPAQIIGQSIDPQEDVFSHRFIQDYSLENWSSIDFEDAPKNNLTPAALKASSKRGWLTTQNHLSADYGTQVIAACPLSASDAFNGISFSDETAQAIEDARAIDLGAFIAIHLRSGDMVYGTVRKWGFWGNKVINPVVAVDMIKQAYAKGQKVVVFGQDVDWLQQAKLDYGVILASDLNRQTFKHSHQQALFEMVLMSRATEIIAGDSGFARAASMIGDKPLKSMFALYSAIQYSDVTLAGLETVKDQLHPHMAAYAYWQAYAFGRTLRSIPQLIDIIEKSHNLDPENHLYLLILAALKFRMGFDAQAEALLTRDYAKYTDDHHTATHPINQQVIFRYYTPKYTHEEQFPDFIAAARRPGNQYAQHIAKLIRSDQS